MKTLMTIIAGVVGAALIFVWHGYAISVLWGWFVVPLGVLPVNWAAASGFSLVALLCCPRVHRPFGAKEPKEAFYELAVLVISPLACLAVGWVFLKFAVVGA